MNHRARLVLGAALVVIAALGIVVSVSSPDCPQGCEAAGRAPGGVVAPPPTPAAMTVTPPTGAEGVDPLGPVLVTATSGRLTDVAMVNEQGNRIHGIMTPDNAVWKPGVPLGYGRTYTMTATALGTDGKIARTVSTFSTLTPRHQTNVSLT
ncbi:MAG: Ig-like domain-containing protein, partial [Mycobacterium sp.]|nr:Ig-like domain-containing protein [Mycobacterium sp.]